MAKQLMTSIAEVAGFKPCAGGFERLLAARAGKLDEEFPIIEGVKSHSISDALWLLGKRKTEISIAVAFARKCADSVTHLKNNRNAADAAADAAAADAAATAAADAAAAAYAAAGAAADAYAAYAAYTAAYAAYTAAYTAAYAAASVKIREQQKQFLRDCITDYERSN